jgi:hypothetical protein
MGRCVLGLLRFLLLGAVLRAPAGWGGGLGPPRAGAEPRARATQEAAPPKARVRVSNGLRFFVLPLFTSALPTLPCWPVCSLCASFC